MKYEYAVLVIVLVMMWQNFSLRRQLKQLWQATDKQKYISRYLELVESHKDQVKAIKALRVEFKELTLLQAHEVSQTAHHKPS